MSARFDYPALLKAATVGVVRGVLADAAERGLGGDHHFFLTFRTGESGVRLPPALAQGYPGTMTIVLQHQFVELEVDDEAFSVALRFGGGWERVRVPFAALTTFLDPSIPFGLDFTQFAGAPPDAGEAVPDATAALGGAPRSGPVSVPSNAESSRDSGAEAGIEPTAPGREPSPEPASGDLLPFRRR